MVPISRLPVLATLRGSWHNVGTCTEYYNINISSDVDPSTNLEENDNLSCLENEINNEDNLFDVDSAWRLDNDKTLNILVQENNNFWYPPDYILYRYKKICNIHLKDDILKEFNDEFTSFDDVVLLFYACQVSRQHMEFYQRIL